MLSLIDDRKVYQGDDKWFDRLKDPQRPDHWAKHPYEIKPRHCSQCGTRMKAVTSVAYEPELMSCIEKWICKCSRLSKMFHFKNGIWEEC